jgi:hypothetical protein
MLLIQVLHLDPTTAIESIHAKTNKVVVALSSNLRDHHEYTPRVYTALIQLQSTMLHGT